MTIQPTTLRIPLSALGTLTELNSGGQGTVYELSGQAPALTALPYPDLLYKQYNHETRGALDSAVLDQMARYAVQLTSGQGNLGGRLAWPLATIEHHGAVCGFLMRRAPQQFMVVLRLPNGPAQKLTEVQLLLNNEQYLANLGLPVHDRWRLQFLQDTADTLVKLHRRGITVGDLSPKNLLASFSSRPCCFFLDCDAMQMADQSTLPQIETPGWELPKGEKPATIASDSYKFALLAIRLFALDQDSKDVGALSSVDAGLGRLARRGLATNPATRPTPQDWLPVLAAATPQATTALPRLQPLSSAAQQTNTFGFAPPGLRSSPGGPFGQWPATPLPPARGPGPQISAPWQPVPVPAQKNRGGILALILVGVIGFFIMQGIFTDGPDTPVRNTPVNVPPNTQIDTEPTNSATAYTELNRQLRADATEVRSNLAETWVPQLASAQPGLNSGSFTYDYLSILQEHRKLRQEYPRARLVWSSDWPSFKGQDFYVTVLAVPFTTAEDANLWCDQQGIDRDHCFAKLLSQSRGPEGSTRHR